MPKYKVTLKGLNGFKEFKGKNELRTWIMNYLNNQDIEDMTIRAL